MSASNNALYVAILDAAARGNKVQQLVRDCFVNGDNVTITEAARLIDENPRFDKAQSRARLAGLRMAMQRVCKELDIPKLTVAKDKATDSWAVVQSEKKTDKKTDFAKALESLIEKAQEEGQTLTLAELMQGYLVDLTATCEEAPL